MTGTPSVFVRTSGCNLRCWFCDTPFASWRPEGEHLAVSEILSQTLAMELSHAVVTGGEPMIHRELVELCSALHANQMHITIETAGTIFLPVKCDLMSISPKLESSAPNAMAGSWRAAHLARRERLEVVERLMANHAYQLKFVVDSLGDAEEVLRYLERLKSVDGERVLLMPQGIEKTALARQATWLIPWCQEHGLQFCPRAHIEWFGNRRGT